jgi:hypothetical protein
MLGTVFAFKEMNMEQIRELEELVWNQEIVLFDAVLNAFVMCRVSDIDVENQYLQLDRTRQLDTEELPIAMAQLAREPLAQTVLLNEGKRMLLYTAVDTSQNQTIINNSKIKLFTVDGLPLPKETL